MSVDEELAFLSARDLVARYRDGSLSPVEATRATLERIAALDGTINAYCLVDGDAAMAAARDSETRWRRGAPAGPLDGVPTSIKDIVLTRGWPTLRGSKTIDPDQEWSDDAPPVARLREQGAVLLGKTTTPEFAMKGVTDSPLTGITRNPWNPDLTPGGSSGGAGAAVAAGCARWRSARMRAARSASRRASAASSASSQLRTRAGLAADALRNLCQHRANDPHSCRCRDDAERDRGAGRKGLECPAP